MDSSVEENIVPPKIEAVRRPQNVNVTLETNIEAHGLVAPNIEEDVSNSEETSEALNSNIILSSKIENTALAVGEGVVRNQSQKMY